VLSWLHLARVRLGELRLAPAKRARASAA